MDALEAKYRDGWMARGRELNDIYSAITQAHGPTKTGDPIADVREVAAERDRCREALMAVTGLLEQQTGFSGGSLPSDEPWDPIEIEINEAVRKAKDALAPASSRTEPS